MCCSAVLPHLPAIREHGAHVKLDRPTYVHAVCFVDIRYLPCRPANTHGVLKSEMGCFPRLAETRAALDDGDIARVLKNPSNVLGGGSVLKWPTLWSSYKTSCASEQEACRQPSVTLFSANSLYAIKDTPTRFSTLF